MKSVVLFGGNFDPVHNGHLITAARVLEFLNLNKLIFVPANISPFKTNTPVTSAIHRIEMLKLAIEKIPRFTYTDLEIKREGVSYTIDTLKILKKEYDSIFLVIGYDNLLEFTKWKEPDEIIRIAKLVVLGRISVEPEKENRFFSKAVFPDTPIIEISSTEIRMRVRNNLPIDFLVPEKVKEYIYRNNLYKV